MGAPHWLVWRPWPEPARALFGGIAAHSMLRLEQRPSAAVGIVMAVAGHAFGWPVPRGGSQQIADSLAAYLQELGGEIVTGQPVGSYRELPAARAYLFDVSPRQLIGIAGDELPPRYLRRLARYRYGRALSVDIRDIPDAPFAMEPEVRKLKYLLESLV